MTVLLTAKQLTLSSSVCVCVCVCVCGGGGVFGGSSPCPFSKLFKSAPLGQIAMILWSIKQNAFEF